MSAPKPDPSRPGPTCSVVVINHNYAEFLPVAVESALAQTYPRVEVLVVDDGSTDNSLALLETYGNRIRVISQANEGHVSAVNAGYGACIGDLVLFLDADDLIYQDCLSRVVVAWRLDAMKIQFRLNTIDRDGKDQDMPFPVYAASIDESEIRRRSLRSGYYPWPVSSGNVFSRDYLRQVVPIDAARIFKSPDGFLNKMAPLFGPVLTLREILGAYRVHGRNAWAQSPRMVRSGPYVRGTRFDAVLHEVFVEAARRRGFAVPPFDRAPVPQWVEVRLLSLKLDPAAHPFARDSVGGVWRLGARAAFGADGLTLWGRILWVGWFIALSVFPRWVVASMVANWRPQSRRPVFVKGLISRSRRINDIQRRAQNL